MGRHAATLDEAQLTAHLTPIFHQMTRGGWRGRNLDQHGQPISEADAEFLRDPLSAPIPEQALVALPARRTVAGYGRHHRSLV